jgi:hypothetical protein
MKMCQATTSPGSATIKPKAKHAAALPHPSGCREIRLCVTPTGCVRKRVDCRRQCHTGKEGEPCALMLSWRAIFQKSGQQKAWVMYICSKRRRTRRSHRRKLQMIQSQATNKQSRMTSKNSRMLLRSETHVNHTQQTLHSKTFRGCLHQLLAGRQQARGTAPLRIRG